MRSAGVLPTVNLVGRLGANGSFQEHGRRIKGGYSMAFGKTTTRPFTEDLNNRREEQEMGSRDLDRPRQATPMPHPTDYDTADSYGPPGVRAQHQDRQPTRQELVLLQGVRNALSEPPPEPPLDMLAAIVRSLTYGDMVEFAASVARTINLGREKPITDIEAASALHQFGKSRKPQA